jgi:PAS domain S-box-containing protein
MKFCEGRITFKTASKSPLSGSPASEAPSQDAEFSAEPFSGRAARMMRAVQRFSETINAEMDLPAAVNCVIGCGSGLLGVVKSALYLAQESGQCICAASSGFSKHEIDSFSSRLIPALTAGNVVGVLSVVSLDVNAETSNTGFVTLVPFHHEGALIGYLAGYHNEERDYALQEVDLAKLFASLAAIVIGNARLYRDTKQSEQDATFLSDASRIFDSSLELSLVLQAAAERSKGVLGDWCSILLLDKDGHYLEPMASSSTMLSNALPKLKAEFSRNPIIIGEGLTGRVAATGKSCLVPDYRSHPQAVRSHLEAFDIRSFMATPISSKGRVLGLMLITTFVSSGRVLKERDLRLSSALAERAAIAIENARLFEQVIEGKRVWEQTFDAIADGISIQDNRFRITRANRSFASLVGLTPRQVIGRKCYETVFSRTEPCDNCPHAHVIAGAQMTPGEAYESQIGEQYFHISTYPLKDANGGISASVHVMKDITEQKILQEQLIRSERLRALGEMASGVAHNFNNLLAAILGRAEIALMQAGDARVVDSLNVIRQAAVDGAQTVRRIQDYSRIRKDIDSSLVNLNEVVLGAIELSKPKWKDEPQRRGVNVELSTQIRPVPFVTGNPSELREVFLNMIFNAVDAMPVGGKLTVRTGVEGNRIMVQIEDTGQGMSEEVQQRIFDPFYTTKDRLGNGLGLSIAYGTITRHGGEIKVRSVAGEGSTFIIYVPKAVEQKSTTQLSQSISVRPARLLVVDDEPDVLETTELVLKGQGHTVSLAHSASEALEILAKNECDLLITDLGMPEMNGWELARTVKDRYPGMPVALFTGWAVEIDTAKMRENGVDRLITKPSDSQTLSIAISEMLADKQEEEVGPLRILVVDDEKRFGEVLAERLQLDGHEVRTVTDGAGCLDLLRNWECDTIFTDYKLPDTSGTELVKEIRELSRHSFIVLMTGYAASVNDPAFIKDVDAVLPKPWKLTELDKTLQDAWLRKCRHETNRVGK